MNSSKVIILGDICPAWGFPQRFADGNVENIFHDILPLLLDADVVLANLESPLTECQNKLKKNSVCLKGHPSDAHVLAKAGIKGVSLGNNHILDYGVKGYEDTIRALNSSKIVYYGVGENGDINKPTIFAVKGKKIGVLAFAEREFNCALDYGIGAICWDDLVSPKEISEAKKMCDYLIVQYHGGIEHYIYPSPYLQKKCRVMADMGADFISCQHSHCIGTREKWNGCEILYGQGNCIFGNESNNSLWNYGLIVELVFEERLTINYIPIQATKDGEDLLSMDDAKRVIEQMEAESEKIVDSDFVQSRWEEFCLKCKDEYLPMAFARNRLFNKLNRMMSGKVIYAFTNSISRRNAMNLIRCDAHREVLQTILETDYYDK